MAVENPFNQTIKYQATHVVKGITAIHDHVIVRDMDFKGRKLASGILLLSDDGKSEGIRPRWAEVYAVGPEQQDVQVGQWVLVEHGRWSRGLKIQLEDSGEEIVIRRADANGIIFVSDEPQEDETISTAVLADRKERVNWAEQ